MTRFVYANASLCSGCDACVDACAASHKARGMVDQARITIVRQGDSSTPVVCRQCENAPCALVCPVDAIVVGKHTVELDEAKCIGCKDCIIACPFGAIMLSTSTRSASLEMTAKAEESGKDAPAVALGGKTTPKPTGKIAVKCDSCGPAEKGPECVRVCPTKALFLVDDKMMRKSLNAKRAMAIKNMPYFDTGAEKKA